MQGAQIARVGGSARKGESEGGVDEDVGAKLAFPEPVAGSREVVEPEVSTETKVMIVDSIAKRAIAAAD